MQDKVTKIAYNNLQSAYDFFNEKLFSKQLPSCMIVLNRKARVNGHFVNKIWELENNEVAKDEISINPDQIPNRSLDEVLSTLVHEMCHLWQFNFGKPSRNGWHNKEWGAKMEEVGLIPSNTGEEGGKKTGQQMTHYIAKNGPFQYATSELKQKGFSLGVKPVSLSDERKEAAKKKKASKTKFSCPECGTNAWGKPDLNIMCGDCEVHMQEIA